MLEGYTGGVKYAYYWENLISATLSVSFTCLVNVEIVPEKLTQ